jgi:hypothetical protein
VEAQTRSWEEAMDLEEKDYQGYVERIKQIDAMLHDPVATLAGLVVEGLRPGGRGFHIPARITEDHKAEASRKDREAERPLQLVTALCRSTLQRVWLNRRRFPELGKTLKALDDGLRRGRRATGPSVLELLAGPFLEAAPARQSLPKSMKSVFNPNCGPLDPTTAAHVSWVLLNAGEGNAYSAAGFLAFFVILWALRRELPVPGGVGAEYSPPSAYLTARCLSPLLTLMDITRRRAEVLDAAANTLRSIDKMMTEGHERRCRQRLPLRLEELAGRLFELSSISISREDFKACAQQIDDIADSFGHDSKPAAEWARAERLLVDALRALGEAAKVGVAEVGRVVGPRALLPKLLKLLRRSSKEGKDLAALAELGIAPPPLPAPKKQRYREDLAQSAQEAYEICKFAFDELRTVWGRCSAVRNATGATLAKSFDELAAANRRIAARLEAAMAPAVRWCEEALMRQVSHASARNLTEFDPGELLSALFATTAGGRLKSLLRIRDAVGKALLGAREDGSWTPGQPFLVIRDLGAWADTSDLVWMLSSTLRNHPEVHEADQAIGAYVDWLDRTRRVLRYESGHQASGGRRTAAGWISERNLMPAGIDTWATAYAINALLGIRELMEYRLWELCEKRFTIIVPSRRLSHVDAVDLGAAHRHRLHRRLAHMARQAAGDDYKQAEYSLVLHGPPGSSKTAITEALATEMWTPSGSRRRGLIRITPADFTRKGADRLDSEARIIFDVLGHLRRVTVLFDEIDDLLRKREGDSEVSFFKLVVPAMLNRLQDLRDACPKQEICFVLATNFVDRIDPALIRKGRIDAPLPVVYPDRESRRSTLDGVIRDLAGRKEAASRWAAAALEKHLAERISRTDYWPWKAFDTLCRETAEDLERVFRDHARTKRDAQALPVVEKALDRANAEVSKMVYKRDRLDQLPYSAELRREFLYHGLAGLESLEDLLSWLYGYWADGHPWPSPWNHPTSTAKKLVVASKGVEHLERKLGGQIFSDLEKIARDRGWRQLAAEDMSA